MGKVLAKTIALVTGAGGGIGQAICTALSAAGATVVATDTPRQIQKARALLPDLDWQPLDVTAEADWASVIDHVGGKYGQLDILVNNAGISIVGKLAETSLQDWRRCQSINVDGCFLGLRAAQNLLAKSGKGRVGGASVINLSSVAGLVGAAFNVAYCTSKGAVRLLSKAAAMEYSALKLPIRVNSVHPGGVRTDMIESILSRYVELGAIPSMEAGHQGLLATHPIGRIGEPHEIADTVVFLASPAASFMHGSELVVDGGHTAM